MFISKSYTVPKVIDFPRYNTKCCGENEILRRIFRVVFRFPLYFLLYLGNLDYFLDSVCILYNEVHVHVAILETSFVVPFLVAASS